MKPRLPNVRIILADPQGSGLLNKVKYNVMYAETEKEGSRRRHQVDTVVEGIGINRLTRNFSMVHGRGYIDDAIYVSDQEAVDMSRYIMREDGLFLGSSSAVNLMAALKFAQNVGPVTFFSMFPRMSLLSRDIGSLQFFAMEELGT